ncbi:MAG: hypothetical protein ACQETI_00445 [Halobacteriota archaeon]
MSDERKTSERASDSSWEFLGDESSEPIEDASESTETSSESIRDASTSAEDTAASTSAEDTAASTSAEDTAASTSAEDASTSTEALPESGADSRDRPASEPDDEEAADGQTEVTLAGATPSGDQDRDAPLADLARHVAEQSSASEGVSEVLFDDEFEGASDSTDLFEEVSLPDPEVESPWDALDATEQSTIGVGGEAAQMGGANSRDYVVEKRQYCQHCPHFSDPPAVACTYEGASIVEVVDAERFRVRNCPMVDDE